MTYAELTQRLTAVDNEIKAYTMFGDQPPAALLELHAWLLRLRRDPAERLKSHD